MAEGLSSYKHGVVLARSNEHYRWCRAHGMPCVAGE